MSDSAAKALFSSTGIPIQPLYCASPSAGECLF